ncbi:unnamed protein product [Kluyveromyces dobzhanskii CBS 2104]|uniref:Spindle pole body component n=1 Tax=Kluyveromyces dobzhanskii CBS 2104 TaxID=1427455 RepID=A0A0A8KZ04_9SACH|nr:unnamed protein product [Kluyveromyces dobzhanskii CBS 2104]
MEVRDVVESVHLVGENVGPFGRRVNAAPLCSEEIKVKAYPIEKTSSERVQESLVVRDLLLVLQGYEGVYIRYNSSYRPDSMAGPEYKVVKMMNVTFKSFSKKLIKIGSIFVKLNKFQQWCCDERYGRIMHRLGHEIRRFLYEDYLTCVKELEVRFKQDVRFSIRDLEMILVDGFIYKFRLLDQIVDRILNSMRERSDMDRVQMDFDNFMEDLRQDTNDELDLRVLYDTRVSLYVKGGSLISIVQEKMEQEQGDERHTEFLSLVLDSLNSVYSIMFDEWMQEGKLDDFHEEFLISDTVSDVDEEKLAKMLDNERLWDTRFVIRKDGLLPQFRDKELQQKILMTGKIWNLILVCCGSSAVKTVASGKSDSRNVDITNDTFLKGYVNECYQQANAVCIKMLYEGYHMDQFMSIIHDQSYVHGVIDQLWNSKFLSKSLFELTRTPTETMLNKLQRHFEDILKEVHVTDNYQKMLLMQLTSVRVETVPFYETLRQFIDEQETGLLNADNFQQLKRMLVSEEQNHETRRKKNSTPTAMYVQFETSIPYPLNIIWTKPVMVQYQMVQRLILILAYHERLLEDTWFEISKNEYWKGGFTSRYRKDEHEMTTSEKQLHEDDDDDTYLRTQCIRLARVLHFQMRSMVKEKRNQVTSAAAESAANTSGATNTSTSSNNHHPYSRLPHDLLNVQQTVQDHVTNVVSVAGLTSLPHIELQEATLDVIHSFIRYVASWRRYDPTKGQQASNTATSLWGTRMDTLKQYVSVWSDLH